MMEITEEKRQKERELERDSNGTFVNTKNAALEKANLLEREALFSQNPDFEEERERLNF